MIHSKLQRITNSSNVDVDAPTVRLLKLAIAVEGVRPDLLAILCDSGVDKDAVDTSVELGCFCKSCSLGDPVRHITREVEET